MSLEAAIAELNKNILNLTESVNKSNDLAERMIGLKSEAIETVKATATKPAAAPKADKPAESPKAEAPKAEPEAPKTEAEKPAAAPLDPIGQAISDYVGTGYDAAHPQAAEERKARSAKVKEIFGVIAGKAGVEVKKHTDIPEKFHGPFLKTIAARAGEGNLVIKAEAEAGAEAEDDLLGA